MFSLTRTDNISLGSSNIEGESIPTQSLGYILPEDVLQNKSSIFLHFFVVKSDVRWNISFPARGKVGGLNQNQFVHSFLQLNLYKRRKDVKRPRNLLFDQIPQIVDQSEIISVITPKIELHIVQDFRNYSSFEEIDPFVRQFMKVSGNRFSPIPFIDTVTVVEQGFVPLNLSLKGVPLNLSIEYSPVTVDRFVWMKQMEASFQHQKETWGSSDAEIEQIKRMFLEVNPTLLYVTTVVAAIHILFDFLAFKNDVSFFKNRTDFRGISTRAVMMNAICQIVILLYLIEEETTILVTGSVAIGVVIEIWKVFKARSFIYSQKEEKGDDDAAFKLKQKIREELESTQEFDRKATNKLLVVLLPVVFGYFIYSLFFDVHVGWYSWAIRSMTAMVYAFGFVRMTPQLFINYKLKSVAHLPWRAFCYKAINTFIDDLFAFIIKMPTMHRISCFRDDIVFCIYLYQRHIYPVDKSRVNEFGQTGEEDSKKKAE